MAARLIDEGKPAFAYHTLLPQQQQQQPMSPGPSPSPPPLVDELDHQHAHQSADVDASNSQTFHGPVDAAADSSGAGQLLLMKSEDASLEAGGSDADDDAGSGDVDAEIGLPSYQQGEAQLPMLHHHHHHQQQQPAATAAAVVRTRRRKAGLPQDERVCVVCAEPASGYNFDRLTCESCKAFFRRNALKAREKIKSCSRGGGCDVSGPQRKHCPSCRLHKCLLVGMKKELILPPEKLEQRAKPKRRARNPTDLVALHHQQQHHQHHHQAAGAGKGGRGRSGGSGSGMQPDTRRRPSAVYMDHVLSTYQLPAGAAARQLKMTAGELALAWSDATLAGRTWSAELTDADQECLACLREAQSRLCEALVLSDELSGSGGGGDRLKDGVGRLEQAFNLMEACIRRIISVVKLMPIFSEADKESQILMLKVNIYGLVIMHSSFFFNAAAGSWEVPLAAHQPDGRRGVSLLQELAAAVAAIIGMRPGANELTLADLDQYCANSHNVYAQLERYSRRDSLVKMLMMALKLFNSESMPACAARESVERAQSVYSLLLKKYLACRFGVPDAMQLYPSLLLTFIDMRTVENKMVEFTKLLSVESLNPLVREFMHVG